MKQEKKLLIVGHPNIMGPHIETKSFFNKAMLEKVKDLPNLEIHYLGESLDVLKEQALIMNYEKIMFQFPFMWYSVPAKLKNYFDKVLCYGFAFGTNYKLEGKKFMVAITTAGAEEYYKHGGFNKYTIEELLRPIERTFEYCKSIYCKPHFVIHGAKPFENGGISQEDFQKKLEEYKQFVEKFCSDEN